MLHSLFFCVSADLGHLQVLDNELLVVRENEGGYQFEVEEGQAKYHTEKLPVEGCICANKKHSKRLT